MRAFGREENNAPLVRGNCGAQAIDQELETVPPSRPVRSKHVLERRICFDFIPAISPARLIPTIRKRLSIKRPCLCLLTDALEVFFTLEAAGTGGQRGLKEGSLRFPTAV